LGKADTSFRDPFDPIPIELCTSTNPSITKEDTSNERGGESEKYLRKEDETS